MSVVERDFLREEDSYGVGPKLGDVSNALMIWALFRAQSGEQPTVGDAMMDFNAGANLVLEAVEYLPWLYLTGKGIDARIGVDGKRASRRAG